MDEGDVRTRMLEQFGMRIEPAMSRYVLRQLLAETGNGFAVMGGDARTGVPIRRIIPAGAFNAATHPPESLVS